MPTPQALPGDSGRFLFRQHNIENSLPTAIAIPRSRVSLELDRPSYCEASAASRKRRDRKDYFRKAPVELEAYREEELELKDWLEKLETQMGWIRR